MRKLIALIVVAALTAALALSAIAFGATKKVGVKGLSFVPKSLVIKKGTTVTWHWSGSLPHNVAGKGFKSKLGPKVTFSHKFTKAGRYVVVCTIHKAAGMTMVIRVK